MNDLRALHDAFGELERRADAATADAALAPPARRRPARLMPVAATVVVVAGLAAGAVWLVPGDNAGTQAGSPPNSASSSPTSARTAPRTPEELIDRFKAVLGDTATFTVTESGPGAVEVTLPPGPGSDRAPSGGSGPHEEEKAPASDKGAAIVGTLTAGGVTGGFDLVTYPALPSDKPTCEGLSPDKCTVSTLPDGSLMRVDLTDDLEGGGTTFHVVVLHNDGNLFEMHVSNQRSAKGNSDKLGTQPPLTTDQMIAILTSNRW